MPKSMLGQIGKAAYLVSRDAGDVKAAERGPAAYAKRRVRRVLTRKLFGLLR